MGRSEPSDQIAINGRGEEATWQHEECPITRKISTVYLHLSEGGTWLNGVQWMCFNLDH